MVFTTISFVVLLIVSSVGSKNKVMTKKNYKTSKSCFLLSLNGNILKSFDNLMDCSRFLNMTQLTKNVINNGSVIQSKYRVFTKDYYLINSLEIKKMNSYTCKTSKRSEMRSKQNMLICDLFPNEKFASRKELAKRIGKSIEWVRKTLNGDIINNKYNVRYMYPELQGLDFKTPYRLNKINL